VSSTRPDQPSPKLSQDELASLVSTLQLEMVGLKARETESEVRNESLQETIVNLAHENELLKRRIYGNKTERLRTSEQQLTLGNLLDGEKQLQKELDVAVAKAHASDEAAAPPPPTDEPKAKPKGRRDLATSGSAAAAFQCWSNASPKYEVPGKDGPTVLGVETPKTLFRCGLLHSSVVAYILVQKLSLGVPHYRLEQHIIDQGVQLDRSMMCRYVEEAGSTLGATIVHAMWQAALKEGCVISTDATSAMVQPEKSKDRQRQACKKGHFFTAVVDCDHVLFAYSEKHTQDFVKKLFGGFTGFLQSDASNVYDILDRRPPLDNDESIALVGCWAHCRRYFFEAAVCKYQVGLQGLMRIRAIYAADDAFRKLPPVKRKCYRACWLMVSRANRLMGITIDGRIRARRDVDGHGKSQRAGRGAAGVLALWVAL